MKAFLIASATIAMLAAAAASAAEIRIVPGDSIVVYPANGRGFSDMVLHSIAVRADQGETVTIDQMRIDLLENGRVVLTENIAAEQLAKETGDLAGAPVAEMVAGQLLDQRGLDGLFGAKTSFGKMPTLAAGETLVTSRRYFATRAAVDAIRVTAMGHDAAGKPSTVEQVVPAAAHRSAVDYQVPIKGVWLMQAVPTLQSHHRLNPSTEFSVDFFKIDADGKLFSGDQLAVENWYGFGADVLAAADGEVVSVTDGEVQDRAALTRRPDESPQAAGERIGAYNMGRMRQDFGRAAAGNLVVLRHERAGIVEYSSYGHLRRGIPVKVGDQIRQGQVIGQVGDTGDSATVHLHFQVNAGPSPFASKSLPATLQGLRSAGGNSELGRMVLAEPQ